MANFFNIPRTVTVSSCWHVNCPITSRTKLQCQCALSGNSQYSALTSNKSLLLTSTMGFSLVAIRPRIRKGKKSKLFEPTSSEPAYHHHHVAANKSCLKICRHSPTRDSFVSCRNRNSLSSQSGSSTESTACTEQSLSAPATSPKRVGFGVVEVREYAPTVSYNPWVRDGVGIELSWEYSHVGCYAVEEFEEQRRLAQAGPSLNQRRKVYLLDSTERLAMLQRNGHSMLDIQQALEVTRKCGDERRRTLEKVKAEDAKRAKKLISFRQNNCNRRRTIKRKSMPIPCAGVQTSYKQ
jgi:hypothetical protein